MANTRSLTMSKEKILYQEKYKKNSVPLNKLCVGIPVDDKMVINKVFLEEHGVVERNGNQEQYYVMRVYGKITE